MSKRLVFGVDTAPPTVGKGKNALIDMHPVGNPCVKVFGAGPQGKTCETCTQLTRYSFGRNVYKCEERPKTHSVATDHRLRWSACAHYEERAEGEGVETHVAPK